MVVLHNIVDFTSASALNFLLHYIAYTSTERVRRIETIILIIHKLDDDHFYILIKDVKYQELCHNNYNRL